MNDVTDLLDGATDIDAAYDSQALVQRAMAQGRQSHRRRRLAATVGVSAACVTALVAPALARGGPDTSVTTIDAATSTGSIAARATPPPAAHGVPSLPDLQARLAAALDGSSSALDDQSSSGTNGNSSYALASRSFDPDSAGAGMVHVAVTAPSSTSRQEQERDARNAAHKCALVGTAGSAEVCHAVDGGWLFQVFEQRPDVTGGADDARLVEATLIERDGTSVQVGSTNYVNAEQVNRSHPVLSLSEVRTLATNGGWLTTP